MPRRCGRSSEDQLLERRFQIVCLLLHTPIDVEKVWSVELVILFLTSPTGTPYRAFVNAHCVYEVI